MKWGKGIKLVARRRGKKKFWNHQRKAKLLEQWFHIVLPTNLFSLFISLSLHDSLLSSTPKVGENIYCVECIDFTTRISCCGILGVLRRLLRQSLTCLFAGLLAPTLMSSLRWMNPNVWWDAHLRRISRYIVQHVHQGIFLHKRSR